MKCQSKVPFISHTAGSPYRTGHGRSLTGLLHDQLRARRSPAFRLCPQLSLAAPPCATRFSRAGRAARLGSSQQDHGDAPRRALLQVLGLEVQIFGMPGAFRVVRYSFTLLLAARETRSQQSTSPSSTGSTPSACAGRWVVMTQDQKCPSRSQKHRFRPSPTTRHNSPVHGKVLTKHPPVSSLVYY